MTILTFKQRLLFLDWPILVVDTTKVVKELLLVKRSKETELIMIHNYIILLSIYLCSCSPPHLKTYYSTFHFCTRIWKFTLVKCSICILNTYTSIRIHIVYYNNKKNGDNILRHARRHFILVVCCMYSRTTIQHIRLFNRFSWSAQ